MKSRCPVSGGKVAFVLRSGDSRMPIENAGVVTGRVGSWEEDITQRNPSTWERRRHCSCPTFSLSRPRFYCREKRGIEHSTTRNRRR